VILVNQPRGIVSARLTRYLTSWGLAIKTADYPTHQDLSKLTSQKRRGIFVRNYRCGLRISGETSDGQAQILVTVSGLPFLMLGAKAQESKKVLKIMMRSSWGTEDPTRASFVFAHALELAEAGHEVQIFLTADAVNLMRKATSDVVIPIGWPPLSELRDKIVAKHIPVFSCGACSRARGVTESDLAIWGAKFGNPAIFVSLVEWADRIISEWHWIRESHLDLAPTLPVIRFIGSETGGDVQYRSGLR